MIVVDLVTVSSCQYGTVTVSLVSRFLSRNRLALKDEAATLTVSALSGLVTILVAWHNSGKMVCLHGWSRAIESGPICGNIWH